MMTFRFAKCAVAVGAIGLAGVLPSSAQAANATADASATIATAISIANNADMNFGTIAEAGAGTVTVLTDGTRTTTGGVSPLSSGLGAAADFTVTGEDSATYSITLPADNTVILSDGANTMNTIGITSLPTEAAGGTLSAGPCPCTETLLVGATLIVGISQVPGAYTTTFTVTVDYN